MEKEQPITNKLAVRELRRAMWGLKEAVLIYMNIIRADPKLDIFNPSGINKWMLAVELTHENGARIRINDGDIKDK